MRPSPLPNRVTPRGDIIATPARGTLMGNRGCIHSGHEIVRPWRVRRWIACRLEWKGVRRPLMQPGRWTELFFLDEATAFAAGHRPCAYCRRGDFDRFRAAWLAANAHFGLGGRPRVEAIDAVLHRERVAPDGRKVTYRAPLRPLPDGVFVELDDAPRDAWLLRAGELLCWTPAGYEAGRRGPLDATVSVLTPRSIVAAFSHGYSPAVHPSTGRAAGR